VYLLQQASITEFGKEHTFHQIRTQKEFAQAVPIRDYEQFKPYIEKVKEGKQDILWRGKPVYFAKTSGTTSGVKYIPITKESIPFHIQAARNALLCYVAETGNAAFVSGKMIFLSGSPELEQVNGIYGRDKLDEIKKSKTTRSVIVDLNINKYKLLRRSYKPKDGKTKLSLSEIKYLVQKGTSIEDNNILKSSILFYFDDLETFKLIK
jgi:hypothetical protein